MGKLDGKVAVITGATSGIGLRTAEIFVAEGARIVVAGRRAPEGEALAKKLGPACVFRQTDVTDEAQMQALIALAVDKFGRIDCLFNNAGGPAQTGGIEGLEVARFDAAMATLVRSVMLGMKHAAPHMRKQGSGSIINNGSIAGRLAGFSSSMVYGAAKAAVIHLTKCVAMELGESGIRVNSISPGAIATGIFGKALGLSVEAAEKTPDVMREVYKSAQPIPRAGLPEDIAQAAVFLASDESTFINGHDLVVDGAITGGRNWTAQQQGLAALRKAFDQGRGEFRGARKPPARAEFTPSAPSAKRTPGFPRRGQDVFEAVRLRCFLAAFFAAEARPRRAFRGQRRRAGALAGIQRRLSRGRLQVHAIPDSPRQAGAGIGLRPRRSAGGAGTVLRCRRRFRRQDHRQGQRTASRSVFRAWRCRRAGDGRLDRGAVRLHRDRRHHRHVRGYRRDAAAGP